MFTSFEHIGFAFLVSLSIFTVVYSQNAQPAQPAQPVAKTPIEKLDEYFYYKCWNAKQSMEAYDKLKNATTDFLNYFASTIELLPNYRKQYCETERQQLEKKILAFSRHLKTCLPEKEKFLSSFLRDSFREFLHFLCHNNGENTNRFFSARARQCRKTLLDNSDGVSLSRCMSRIFAPSKGIDNLTQSEFCDDFTILKKCFNTVLTEKCPTYEPYQALNEELFRYIAKPCSSPSSSVNYLGNIFLLTVSFFVSYLINQ